MFEIRFQDAHIVYPDDLLGSYGGVTWIAKVKGLRQKVMFREKPLGVRPLF